MDGGLSCLITLILIIGVRCHPILVTPGCCRHHITATRIGGRFCQLRADSTTLPAFLLNESTWVVRAQSEQNRRRSDLTLGIQQKFKLGRRDARVAGSLAVIGPSLRARACAREKSLKNFASGSTHHGYADRAAPSGNRAHWWHRG